MRFPVLAVLAGLVLLPAARAADWKPADAPLMTRWAKDVKPDRVLPEYPRPQLRRERWQNLNGLWQFAVAKESEAAPVGRELADRILVPFPVESALSGIMKHADRLWYRRTFTVPAAWAGQRVLLHFGAVDWEATVTVNGKTLGSHRGGYDAFSFDVTDALKGTGEQELIVGVWDPTNSGPQPRGKQVLNPRGIYYTPVTGIWQTVWLEPVPAVRVQSLVLVPDLDQGAVRVGVVAAGTAERLNAKVEVTANGRPVVSAMVPTLRDGLRPDGREYVVPIPSAKPWTPESPFLYDVAVTLRDGDKDGDRVEGYVGLRKIDVGPDEKGVTRVRLNGQPVFMAGPLDQGFWPDGIYTAPTDEALKFDVEATKQLGFNCTRKHVKVEPDRWYYWCDKLGLLVWQDMPSGDKSVATGRPDLVRSPESAKQYELELRRMIDGLGNHPSIIAWVVFNEGWGQFDTARISDWTKQHDPTRLVDGASGWNDRKCGDVYDLHAYPGPASPDPEPKRAAMLGEFGGLGLGVDGHTWAKRTWGYRGTDSRADLTRQYERLFQRAYELRDRKGLSVAIYTQLTDVETEANGLYTYDREVLKVDGPRAAAAARGDFSQIAQVRELVPTSREKGQRWRYTIRKPADDWLKNDFDDSSWQEGEGGFGTAGTPGAVVRTEWKTDDVWLRREFELPAGPLGDVWLLMHHDEDAEVYVNGVLAVKAARYISGYEEFPISVEARAALKPGKNRFAVHCKQTTGGQYIDVGLVELRERQPKP